MGKTNYTTLKQCESPKEASQVVELLKAEEIPFKYNSDSLTISVDESRHSDAVLLLAKNNVPTTGMSMEQLLDNNLNTTNSDRTLKLNLYIQNAC